LKEVKKEYSVKELLLMQLETIEKLEKAEHTVSILTHVNKTYVSTEIAKDLNFKSAFALNKYLHDMKIQYRQNDTWVLYSKYADCGYVQIKQEVLDNGRVIYHRRWTQLGREFLINLLNESRTVKSL
jgi:phage antirepressor YoqD-like protein